MLKVHISREQESKQSSVMPLLQPILLGRFAEISLNIYGLDLRHNFERLGYALCRLNQLVGCLSYIGRVINIYTLLDWADYDFLKWSMLELGLWLIFRVGPRKEERR